MRGRSGTEKPQIILFFDGLGNFGTQVVLLAGKVKLLDDVGLQQVIKELQVVLRRILEFLGRCLNQTLPENLNQFVFVHTVRQCHPQVPLKLLHRVV